jgi:hypothetical protein
LDEAGRSLRVFILAAGSFRDLILAIKKEISLATLFADSILLVQTDVEPDWTIERPMLIHTKPS